MRWVLGISLALNLVFVGLFAGAAFRYQRDGGDARMAGPPVQSYGGQLARSLPRDARRTLLRGLRSDEAGLPNRRERQAIYRQVLEALRAEPFDVARVEAIFATHGDVAQKVQNYAQTTWLALVAEMSADERYEVAYRLEEALRRPKRKPKKRVEE